MSDANKPFPLYDYIEEKLDIFLKDGGTFVETYSASLINTTLRKMSTEKSKTLVDLIYAFILHHRYTTSKIPFDRIAYDGHMMGEVSGVTYKCDSLPIKVRHIIYMFMSLYTQNEIDPKFLIS